MTCVWCRAVWVSASTSGASGQAGTSREGYLNLSGVTGVSPVRDTSSCAYSPCCEDSWLCYVRPKSGCIGSSCCYLLQALLVSIAGAL